MSHLILQPDSDPQSVCSYSLTCCCPNAYQSAVKSCSSTLQVDLSVINGEVVVRGGVLQTLDVAALVKEHNRRSAHICSYITDSASPKT